MKIICLLSLLRNLIHEREDDANEAESVTVTVTDTLDNERWSRIKHTFKLNINFDNSVAIDELLPTEGLPTVEEFLSFLSMNTNVESIVDNIDFSIT